MSIEDRAEIILVGCLGVLLTIATPQLPREAKIIVWLIYVAVVYGFAIIKIRRGRRYAVTFPAVWVVGLLLITIATVVAWYVFPPPAEGSASIEPPAMVAIPTPSQPVITVDDKIDSPPKDDGGIQGIADDPAAPDPVVRLPHENPSPEYIAKIRSEASSSTREFVTDQFVGTPVSWDGTFGGVSDIEPPTIRMVVHGSDFIFTTVYIRVKLPEQKFLLQLDEGRPIHAEGIIEKFEYGTPYVKDTTVTLLPDSRGTKK